MLEGSTGLALRAALAWLEVRSARERRSATADESPSRGGEEQARRPVPKAAGTGTGEAGTKGPGVRGTTAGDVGSGAEVPVRIPEAGVLASPGEAVARGEGLQAVFAALPEEGEERGIFLAGKESRERPSPGGTGGDEVSGSESDGGNGAAGGMTGQDEMPEEKGGEEGQVRLLTGKRVEREGARRLAERRSIPRLAEALRTSPDERDRERAARALGRIDDPRVVEPLIEGLRDIHPLVRKASAAALGETGRRRAVEPLLQLLDDPDPEVRREAQLALVRIGDAVLHPLISLLKDDREKVRRAAADTLGMFFEKEETEPLALNFLISALRDGDIRSRAKTAAVLGEVGKPWVVKPLIEALYFYTIRDTVRDALVKMGTQAVEPLVAALHHHHISVRRAAAEILGEVGDARAMAPLRSALKDKDWSVRKAAQESLARVLERVSPQKGGPLPTPGSRTRGGPETGSRFGGRAESGA